MQILSLSSVLTSLPTDHVYQPMTPQLKIKLSLWFTAPKGVTPVN